MNSDRELMQMALDALQDVPLEPTEWSPVVEALRERLSQPEPEREWVGLDVAQFEHIEQLFGNKVSNEFVLADIICLTASMLKEKNT